MTTTENLRDWMLQCPVVQNLVEFYTDYSGQTTSEATIFTVPSPLNSYEDICGNISYKGKQTLQFIFALSVPYGNDVQQALDNLEMFEQVRNWMTQQNVIKNLPHIDEGTVDSIMPIRTEHLSDVSPSVALYEMQCALVYWRDVD